MYKTLFASVLILLCCAQTYAQHKVDFEVNLTATKVKNSIYGSIQLLDSRNYTTNIGFVQTGAFNRNAKVVTKRPLAAEVASIFNSLIEADAGKGELLLQLRQFSFAEVISGMSETGYCAMQADLYAKTGDRYQRLATIDTLFRISSGVDVTNKLLRLGSDTLTGFIRDNLLSKPHTLVAYSFNDVMHIDSIEKRAIKLYNSATYADGLYLTYNSFKNQTPDKEINVINTYLYPGNVKALDDKGRMKDIKLNKTYAFVYKGQPYIVTRYGFYPLNLLNDEFLFTGKAKASANTGTVMLASAMFGMLGGLIAGSGDDATYEMKINHHNGSVIKLKEIKETIVRPTVSKGDSWD